MGDSQNGVRGFSDPHPSGRPIHGDACQLAIGTVVVWFCFASEIAFFTQDLANSASLWLSAITSPC